LFPLHRPSAVSHSFRTRRSSDLANAGDPVMAFSYMPREYDESKYIADTITQTGAQIVPLETSPQQLWASLGRVLWFQDEPVNTIDRKSTRLNSSHEWTSYAVFCL